MWVSSLFFLASMAQDWKVQSELLIRFVPSNILSISCKYHTKLIPLIIKNLIYKRQMNSQWVPTKPNFGPPPPGYVAGIGRGATGFTTRGDLGPTQIGNVQLKQQDNDEAHYTDNKYDQWQGFKGPLFVRQNLDEEDKQAEQAYDFCERRVQQRRLNEKQKKLKEQMKKEEKNPLNVPISQLFTDLKRQLAKVTQEQWSNIPEAVDLSIAKQKKQKFTPVPDSMLTNHISSNINNKTITQQDPGRDYRQAKSILFKSNLEKAENESNIHGRKIDKVGYLTNLDISRRDEEFLGDIKRARLLHKSALQSNPKNPDIWLSAARIEELEGKLVDCRNVLRRALEHCSGNEDIWIELSRVEKADESKNVLVEALRHLPKSQKIWLTIARKQGTDKQMKSKVLRRGLQNLPQSNRLWKELIELEDLEEAKKLLYKAVECLPKQIDLWVGLAKLENYQNAKQVLNKARRANPLSLTIWINAAKLEQTQSDNRKKTVQKIEQLIRKARSTLEKNGNIVSRDQWFQEALICERSNNLCTCQSIIKATIFIGLTEEQLNHSIFRDVDLYEKQEESIYTTRYLYREGISLTKNPRLLQKLLQFEERLSISKKNSEIVESMNFGLNIFPNHASLWLGLIDKFIESSNFENAHLLIDKAKANIGEKDKQQIQLKRVKIMKINGEYEEARQLLLELMSKYPNSLSSIQLIHMEYQTDNYVRAWQICSELFKKYKNSEIWELAIKIKKQIGSYEEYKALAEKSVIDNPNSIDLWKIYIELQIENNMINKARALIDRALMKNLHNQQLYLTLIELQTKNGSKKQVVSTISKALKQCPKSGEIWAKAILIEPHNTQKKKASVAIQNCGNCTAISCTVAKIFWKDNKIDKARNWLEETLKVDRTNGDLWGYYYKLIADNYPNDLPIVLEEFKTINRITHGRKWLQVKKRKGNWRFNSQKILEIVSKELGQFLNQMSL